MPSRKIFVSVLSATLLLVLSITTGCTFNNQATTYHADVTFRFQAANATGGGYILIPLLLKEDKTMADVSNNLVSSNATCHITIAQTQKGQMLNISLNHTDCSGQGGESIKEGTLRDSEHYLKYVWSSVPSEVRPSKLGVFVSLAGNQSGNHKVDLKMTFSGKSNYCFRTADFHGALSRNGTWQDVLGTDQAVCQ